MANREFDIEGVVKSFLFPRNSTGYIRAQTSLTGHLQTSGIDQRLAVASEALQQISRVPAFQSEELRRATILSNLIIGSDSKNNIMLAQGNDQPLTALNQLVVARGMEAVRLIEESKSHPELADQVNRLKAGLTARIAFNQGSWFSKFSRGLVSREQHTILLNSMPVLSTSIYGYPYLRPFAGMSMEEVLSMPTPLSDESFSRMCRYMGEFFNPRTNFETGEAGLEQAGPQAAKLLYEMFFRRSAERSPLDRLSGEWQRRFVKTLVLEMVAKGQGETQERPMQKLTKNIISTVSGSPFEGISFLVSGYIFDSLSGAGLSARDSRELVQKWQEYGSSKHSDDPDYLYFNDPISVALETASAVPDYINPDPYALPEEIMTPRIKDSIKANLSKATKEQYQKVAGLASVDDPQRQIKKAKEAWDRIEEKEIHFLPSSNVIDVIDYDEERDEYKFGINTCSTQFLQEEDGLSVRVRFDLKTGFVITGEIASDGILHFSNEAIESTDDIVPQGFKAYLNKVANRVIHDIVVQRRVGMVKPQEKRDTDSDDGSPSPDQGEYTGGRPTPPDNRDQRVRNLPRTAWVRSSNELRGHTGVVMQLLRDAHPVLLPYSNPYLDSIVEYLALVGTAGQNPDAIVPLSRLIEDKILEVKARRDMVFRPSPDKLAKVPAGIRLQSVWDPSMDLSQDKDDDGFVIQTWVKSTEIEGQTVYRRNKQHRNSALDWED